MSPSREPARRTPAHVVFGYLDRGADPSTVADAVVVRAASKPQVVRRLRLGPVDGCLFEGGAVDVVPHHRAPADGLVVGYVHEGEVVLSQGDREVTLGPGQLAFYDGRSPFRVRSAGRHRYLVVRVPFQRMRGQRLEDDAVLARDLTAHPSAALLAVLLARVVDLPEDYSAAAAGHLGDAVTSCVHAVLADSRHDPAPTTHLALLFQRLTDWLDDRLDDPSVTAEVLAEAQFLSPRYVRRIFADHGTTVSDYLRRRRLDMVRADLLDPARDAEAISTIGARWGFRDPSGLSRAFARQFGVSPQRFRRQLVAEGREEAAERAASPLRSSDEREA